MATDPAAGSPSLAGSAARSAHDRAAPAVDRQVRFDPQTEQIVDDDEANQLVRRRYRENHWAVPKGV